MLLSLSPPPPLSQPSTPPMACPATAAQGLNPEAEEFLFPHEIPKQHLDDLPLSFPYEFPESTDPIRFCPPPPPPPQPPFPHPFTVLPSPCYSHYTPVIPIFDQNGFYVGPLPLISSPWVAPPPCIRYNCGEIVITENKGGSKNQPQKKASGKKCNTAQFRRPIAEIGAVNKPPRLQWSPKTYSRDEIKGKGESFIKRSSSVPASAPLTKYDPTPRRCSSVPAAITDGFYKRRPNRATGKPKLPLIALTSEGNKTTVMIRNIPNRYSREMIKKFLLNHCKFQNEEKKGELKSPVAAFDFLYLPIDFQSGYNQGYAFVNFTTPEAAWTFLQSKNLQTWDLFHSNKIREICRAKLQGKEALIKKFEGVKFPEEIYQPQVYEPGHDGFTEVEVEETSIGICTKKPTFLLK